MHTPALRPQPHAPALGALFRGPLAIVRVCGGVEVSGLIRIVLRVAPMHHGSTLPFGPREKDVGHNYAFSYLCLAPLRAWECR
jgi:hypothetical protein